MVFRSKVNHLYPIFCPDLIRGINRLSKHSHVDQIFGAWLLREMHHCQIDSEIPLYFPPCAVRVIFAVIHVKIGAYLPSISKKTKSCDRWQKYMVSEKEYSMEKQLWVWKTIKKKPFFKGNFILPILIYLNVPSIFHFFSDLVIHMYVVVLRSHLSPQEIQPMVARHEVDRGVAKANFSVLFFHYRLGW